MATELEDRPSPGRGRRRHRRHVGPRMPRPRMPRLRLARPRPTVRPASSSAPTVLLGVAVAAMAIAVALATAASRNSSSPPPDPCPPGGLTVVAAPDIAASLSDLAGAYAASPGRVCSQVEVVAKPTADAVAAFERGWDEGVDGPRPDVWVPESSVWPRLLDARRSGDTGPTVDLPSQSGPSVAYSPLVVAVPEAAATDLGWSASPPRWSELVDLLTSANGWASLGHPEWGRATVAIADPARSTPGLQAVVAVAGAVRGLEQEEYLPSMTTNNPAVVSRLDAVHSAVSVTGAAGPGLLADADIRAEAGQVTLYLVSERDVLNHNQTGRSRLVAIYPSDGTPLSDYPYLLVGKDQMGETNRAAAAAFLGFLDAPTTRDELVADGFRRGSASEGAPFNDANGLAAAPSRPLLPATGGSVLAGLAAAWNHETA